MQATKRNDTKSALILAAERLFAQKGLAAVSVREITRAAGARNESALQYHFGGMDALIREVFTARYIAIEEARLFYLAELDAAGAIYDIEELMKAAIRPLFEACIEEEGRLYARFCVQLAADPRFNVVTIVNEIGMKSAIIIRDRVLKALSDIPQDMLITRLRRIFMISMVLMADHARLVERGDAPTIDEATDEAARSLAGFLRAHSPPAACD